MMRPSLDEALAALFDSQETPQVTTPRLAPQQVTRLAKPGTGIEQERLQLAAAQKAIDSLKVLLDAAPAGRP